MGEGIGAMMAINAVSLARSTLDAIFIVLIGTVTMLLIYKLVKLLNH